MLTLVFKTAGLMVADGEGITACMTAVFVAGSAFGGALTRGCGGVSTSVGGSVSPGMVCGALAILMSVEGAPAGPEVFALSGCDAMCTGAVTAGVLEAGAGVVAGCGLRGAEAAGG